MNVAVTYSTCAMMCIGLFFIFRGNILYLLRSTDYSLKKLYTAEGTSKQHLRYIFQITTNGKHINEKILIFLALSFMIFLVMGVTMFGAFGIKGLILAVLMAAMPYGYLRTKMYVKQVMGSFEGERLVDELLNQYKICEGDIYGTVDRCAIALDDDTISKKALFQLALKLHSFSGEKELMKALNEFVANWDTVWARMLADNIYNAVREEVNITHGLENILISCKEINKFIEENKKDGIETEVVVKVICPLFFIVLLFMAKDMMGYSISTLLRYEFTEKGGLMIFSALVFLSGLNLIVLPILGKQKYDL